MRFTGRSYVLPSRGQRGLPITSINTDQVIVELFRIGDRSLVSTLIGGNFAKQLDNWQVNKLRKETGTPVYQGTLKVRRKLNREVTTALPVATAIKTLEPGVYAVAAWANANAKRNGNNGATQWFIVSDLGLTTYKSPDGLHTFVRSLATAKPLAGVTVRLVARNNEVLGTAETNTRGYVRFERSLANGEGGQSPAVITATDRAGDYAFLNLTTDAFDLTDRGVKGRIATGPSDGFLYTDRGIYRPGEQAHIAALFRNATQRALNLPVTLIVSRPDGVEHRRMSLSKPELGGHTRTIDIAHSAMTGTWRAALYTDPKAPPIARTAFRVEDFVPERLTMSLEALSRAIFAITSGQNKTGRAILVRSSSNRSRHIRYRCR